MRIHGKVLSSTTGTANEWTAEIEISLEELIAQMNGQGWTVAVYPPESKYIHFHEPLKPEYCSCPEPEEYTERNSATGDKVYSGKCIKCLKPIRPKECRQCEHPLEKGIHTCEQYKPKPAESETKDRIEELDINSSVDFSSWNSINKMFHKINELIRAYNRKGRE